jgi:hypothetical protein
LIAEVLAFVAVVALAIAPRTIVPLLRGAVILYALGISPYLADVFRNLGTGSILG